MAESLIVDAGTVATKGIVNITNVTGAVNGFSNLTVTNGSTITLGQVNLPGSLTVTDTDAGIGSVNFGNTVVASGGVSIEAPAIAVANNVTTAGTDILFTGDVTIADGQAVIMTTGGGNFTVTGALQGATTGASESVNISAGVGLVNISDLRGATSGAGGANGLTVVSVVDSANITLSDVTLFGTLDVNTTGNAGITSSGLTQSLQLSGNVTGDLTVTAAGNVSSFAALTVGGNSTFTVTNNSDITLNDLDAAGIVSLDGASATIVNAQTLTLGAVTIGDVLLPNSSNDATLTATTGTITGAGVIEVADELILIASSGTGGVNLNNANNIFGSLDITSPTGIVNIRESNQTDLIQVNAATLTVDSGGSILATSTGGINVTGLATLSSEGNITFDNTGARALSDLSILEGDIVSLENTGAIILRDVTATELTLNNAGTVELRDINLGQFTLTSTGAVTDTATGTVTVTGLTTVDPGGNDITLNLVNLGTIRMVNSNDITIVNEIDDIEIDNIVASSLSINASGDITQTASSIVNITNQFNLVGGGDVVLDGNNTFGSIQLTGNSVEIDGSGDIAMETIVATTLKVTTSGGNITQQAATNTTVAGLATFETIGGNITLTDPASSFGSISLTGNDVQFAAVGAIEVEGIDADTLDFVAGGNITGAGLVVVTGLANFDAGTSSLDLSNANNSIGTLSVTASSVDLSLSSDVELDQLDVSGIFDLTAGGGITDATSANINVGEAILDATGDIILGDSGSVDLAVLNLSGANIDITVSAAAEIESVSGDDFSLSAGGDITQSDGSDIDVASATFSNAGNDIILTGNDNSLGSVEITSAGNVEIATSGAIQLNDINADTFTLLAGGAVTDGGRVSITGEFNVDAGISDILLNQNNHAFGSIALVGSEVRINDAGGDTTLLDVNVDILELISSGDVTGDNEIRVGEELIIAADDGVGQIRLTNINNRLDRISVTGSLVEVINTLDTESWF